MKITQQKKEEIVKKTKVLEEAQKTLKEEYIGIDHVIDELINSIKPYYFFSEFLKRPLVINLWGLTGTGKTSIINRLCVLLGLADKHFKFDCGEYVGSGYALKSEINDKLSKLNETNIIMTFDEFQLCRTIDAKGLELDRIGLRPLWELIDSGVFFAYRDYNYEILRIFKTLHSLKEVGVVTEKGIVTQEVDSYKLISGKNYKSFDGDSIDSKPYFMKIAWFKVLVDQNPSFFKSVSLGDLEKFLATDDMEIKSAEGTTLNALRKYFEDKTIEEIVHIVRDNFVKTVEAPKQLNFSQSLIFCIGNLDEAYQMTHSVNPDSDPDLFHQHSLKISVPQIKAALSTRFRMEQIGRLGNNHIIYPSFSKNNYTKIITHYLKQRIALFKNEYSIDLSFTPSLESIIYKESVFPTQGIRPVLSTLSNQIDSYVSRIISDILIEAPDVENINKVVWDYNAKKNKYYVDIITKDNTVLQKVYNVNLMIEKLRLSDQSEKQAYVAVHESGHAVMAIYDLGIVPKEIRSKTADSDKGGFCSIEFPDITTKDSIIKEIKLLYGGIEAERLIFGEDMISTGASTDLIRATSLVVKYFKTYGMDESALRISSITDDDGFGNKYLHDKSLEEKAKEFASKLRKETAQFLETHKEELVKLANVLAKKSRITSKDISTILDLSNVKLTTKDKYYAFKEKLNNATTGKKWEMNGKAEHLLDASAL